MEGVKTPPLKQTINLKLIIMKRILEVQKELGTLSKNAKNPFFKSAYLDLSDLLQHVTPILSKNGLVLLQPLQNGSVGTQIIDSVDGKVLAESFINIPENITDPQKIGSCISYFRRYTLKSLLSIAEVDDDGNKAAKPKSVRSAAEVNLRACKTSLELQDVFSLLSKEDQLKHTNLTNKIKNYLKGSK